MLNSNLVASDHSQKPQSSVSGAKLSQRSLRVLLRAIFKFFFKVRVIGLENVSNRPFIICANHLGWTDTFLLLLFLPAEPRIYVLGERQVAHISPLRHAVISRLKVMIPLDRDKPREALHSMSDILKGGASLLIFPEGQLGTIEGALLPLQNGASHLSLYTNTPILPVGLTGPHELWLRRQLTIRIDAPIEPAQFSGDLRTRMSTLTWQIDVAMRSLLPGDNSVPKIKLFSRWLTELL